MAWYGCVAQPHVLGAIMLGLPIQRKFVHTQPDKLPSCRDCPSGLSTVLYHQADPLQQSLTEALSQDNNSDRTQTHDQKTTELLFIFKAKPWNSTL